MQINKKLEDQAVTQDQTITEHETDHNLSLCTATK